VFATSLTNALVFTAGMEIAARKRDVFQPVGMGARALDVTRVRVLVDSLVITVSMVGVKKS